MNWRALEARFNGKSIRVRRYRLNTSDAVDIMVEASTGKVMMAGVVVAQELVMTRQGF